MGKQFSHATMKVQSAMYAFILALGVASCSTRHLTVEGYLLLELRGQEAWISSIWPVKLHGIIAFVGDKWHYVEIDRGDVQIAIDSLRGVLYSPALRPLESDADDHRVLFEYAKLGYFIGVNGHSMISPRDQGPLTREQVLRWVRPEHCCAFEIGWSLAWRDLRKSGPAIVEEEQ
jgi:hypothetical protein